MVFTVQCAGCRVQRKDKGCNVHLRMSRLQCARKNEWGAMCIV